MIKLIAIVDAEFGIAKNGEIPWSFSDDLEFFHKKTKNSVIVMGKNTYFSIKNAPLKDRLNCVISKTLKNIDGVKIFQSLEEVVNVFEDFWIIGGAELYNYAIKNNLVECILITQVYKKYNADKFIDILLFEKFSKKNIFKNNEYSIDEYTA